MDMIWKSWGMSRRELFWSLAAALGGSIFGILVVAGVVLFSDADSYAVLGSFIALLVWLMVVVFTGSISFEKQFSMALSMGRTRKEVFICRYVVQQVNILIGMAFIAALNIMETGLGRVLYQGLPCEFSIVGIIANPYIVVMAAIGLPVIYIFFGMLLAKFQTKALWGLWVVWMAGSLMGSNIASALSEEPHGIFAGISGILRGIVKFVTDIGIYGQFALVAILCLVLLIVAWLVLKRQEVTQV